MSMILDLSPKFFSKTIVFLSIVCLTVLSAGQTFLLLETGVNGLPNAFPQEIIAHHRDEDSQAWKH